MDITVFRRAALDASDDEILALITEVKSALEGDSDDAEQEALVTFARFFGIEWQESNDQLWRNSVIGDDPTVG